MFLIHFLKLKILLQKIEGLHEIFSGLSLILLALLVFGDLFTNFSGLGIDDKILTGGLSSRFHLNNNCNNPILDLLR